MSKKIIRLKESDIKKYVAKILSEQVQPLPGSEELKNIKYGSSIGPGGLKTTTTDASVTLNANLFANGIDKINTNSDEFKKGLQSIKDAYINGSKTFPPKGLIVNVIGGASAVGGPKYDNKSLALRRAQNFIISVVPYLKDLKIEFKIANPIVGVATEKNSVAAQQEQFVKLQFNTSIVKFNDMPAVNNTQLVMRLLKRDTVSQSDDTTNTKDFFTRICYMVPNEKIDELTNYVKKIGGAITRL
jgi:hypothetical protein